MCSLGIEPTTFALLTQCSTTEPQEHQPAHSTEISLPLTQTRTMPPRPFQCLWSSPFCLVAHTKMNIPIIYMLFQHLSIKKVTVQIHSCMRVFKLCSSVNENDTIFILAWIANGAHGDVRGLQSHPSCNAIPSQDGSFRAFRHKSSWLFVWLSDSTHHI